MATIIDRYKLIIDTQSTSAGLNNLGGKLKGIGAAIGVAFAADKIIDAGRAIVDIGKKYETMRNQLKLVTTSQTELNAVFGQLQQVSNRTFSGLDDTVDLFQKLTLSTQSLGASTDDIIKVTQNFQSALALSGADANTASAAIRQFGQAMASGVVRGDEFTSIVEALGPALAIMGQESGLTIGKLREMSQAGELTAEVMLEIFKNADKVRQVMAALTVTTDQLQTTLGKTFSEVANKVDNATGITSKYRSVLQSLNRTFADLFNTSTSLKDFSPEELFRMAAEEGQNFDTVLYELQKRLEEVAGFYFPGFGFSNQEEVDGIQAVIDKLKDLQQQRQADKQLADEQARADAAEQQRIKGLLAPYAQLQETLKATGNAYKDNIAPIVKLREEYAATETLITDLNKLRGTEVGQLLEVEKALETSQGRLSQLNEEMEKSIVANNGAGSSFEDFYSAVINQSGSAVEGLDFVARAIEQLTQQFEAGVIGPELYNNALDILQSKLGETANEVDVLQNKIDSFASSAQSRVEAAMAQAELAGLSGIERDMREIELSQERILNNAIRSLETMAASGKISAQQLRESTAELREQNAETTKLLQNAERIEAANTDRVKQQQRTFAYGWNNAFKSYAEDATNAAKQAERLFAKTTRGMEDLFVGFAKTGKFEWKGFVQSITETLLQSQIQGLIADIFGGGKGSGSSGGILGSIGSLFGLGGSGQVDNSDLNSGGLGSIFGDIFGGGASGGGMVANGTAAAPFYVIPTGGAGLGGFGGGAGNISNITSAFRGSDRINELLGMGGSAGALGRDIAQRYNVDYRAPPNPYETTGLGDMFKKAFAGFFANGGGIPAGSFGIVGEAGPEFVSGPANVTPMGGGSVTYNINAVDAPSFQALLARDPGFIHSLAAQGGRQAPRRRR